MVRPQGSILNYQILYVNQINKYITLSIKYEKELYIEEISVIVTSALLFLLFRVHN
jgi:hypothetical protein